MNIFGLTLNNVFCAEDGCVAKPPNIHYVLVLKDVSSSQCQTRETRETVLAFGCQPDHLRVLMNAMKHLGPRRVICSVEELAEL